jgi:hypothetical protein
MLGVVDFLVFFEQASEYVLKYWELAKEATRQWLGPSPHTRYLLFANDEVIIQGKEHCKYAHVAYYSSQDRRITNQKSTAPYKRLPWISIQHCIGDHVIDLSDWLTETRANTQVTLLGILRLASYALNMHLPETENAKLLVITRDGEEEEYKYVGRTKLLQRISPEPVMQHRPTLPFDVLDGGGLFF